MRQWRTPLDNLDARRSARRRHEDAVGEPDPLLRIVWRRLDQKRTELREQRPLGRPSRAIRRPNRGVSRAGQRQSASSGRQRGDRHPVRHGPRLPRRD
jgi:hypothetical protein